MTLKLAARAELTVKNAENKAMPTAAILVPLITFSLSFDEQLQLGYEVTDAAKRRGPHELPGPAGARQLRKNLEATHIWVEE
jgi:hypothetical protein